MEPCPPRRRFVVQCRPFGLWGGVLLLTFLIVPAAFSDDSSPKTLDPAYAQVRAEAIERTLLAAGGIPPRPWGRSSQPVSEEEPAQQKEPSKPQWKLPFVQEIDGFLHNRHYFDLERDSSSEETYELRSDFRLETLLRFGTFATGKLSGNLELDWGADRDDFRPEEQTLQLWEAYADWTFGSLDARIGQQVIRWGKGDEVNPIDNFTPENFKEFINLDRADRKIPIPAVDLKYFFTERLMWEGIWIPVFQEALLDEADEDWDVFFRKNYRDIGFSFLPESRPRNGLRNSTWATRLVHRGSAGDISLTYSYHFESIPSFERDIARGVINTVWRREHSVGSDFEVAHGGWGFRGETVYTTGKPHITNNTADENLVEEKDLVQSLLGVDHTFKNDFYVNVQLIQDFIFNHHEDMEAREYEASWSYRLWKKYLHGKLKFQWTGRSFLTDRNFFTKFDVTYELRENLELVAGVIIFEGEAQGTLGQFDRNDQAFFSTKYYF